MVETDTTTDNGGSSTAVDFTSPQSSITNLFDSDKACDLLTIRRGTGRVLPTEFIPPPKNRNPTTLFPGGSCLARPDRFVYYYNPRRVLIYALGALYGPNLGGWAVVYGPHPDGKSHLIKSGCLERKGPFGDRKNETGLRTNLRAIIAALRLRDWKAEGFDIIVIASYYSIDLESLSKWVVNGWKGKTDHEILTRDLWEMLLGEVEKWEALGVWIQIWQPPEESFTVAFDAAKKAAEENKVPAEWTD